MLLAAPTAEQLFSPFNEGVKDVIRWYEVKVATVQIADVIVVFAYLIIPATILVIISSRLVVQLMIIWLAATVALITGLL